MRAHTVKGEEDHLADEYVKYYTSQDGGRLPVFRGQEGAGLGAFLSGMLRRVVPYVHPMLSSGLSSFISGTHKGMSAACH